MVKQSPLIHMAAERTNAKYLKENFKPWLKNNKEMNKSGEGKEQWGNNAFLDVENK